MRLTISGLIAAGLFAGCAMQQPAPASTADAAIRAATQQWIAAFSTCTHPSMVASLYGPDALLWGTVSPGLTSTPEALLQYFERACTSTPKPTVELGQYQVRSYGESATSSGTYTFTTYLGGQPRVSPARFSFTFRRMGDRWLIVNHHSSLMPAPAGPQASQARQ